MYRSTTNPSHVKAFENERVKYGVAVESIIETGGDILFTRCKTVKGCHSVMLRALIEFRARFSSVEMTYCDCYTVS